MKLTLLLIPLLLLSSCTIDWNDEKDKKITELENQNIELKAKNDDELFKKNKECSKEALGDTKDLSGIQVFYSPKNKSCILIATLEDKKQSGEEKSGVIFDIITKELIFMLSFKDDKITYLTSYNSGSLIDISADQGKCIFDKKVNDLKQRDNQDIVYYFQNSENCN